VHSVEEAFPEGEVAAVVAVDPLDSGGDIGVCFALPVV
jgi:Lhr-like helicase